MNQSHTAGESWQANLKRRTVKLAYWTLAWLVTMAVATFGPVFLWDSHAITACAVAVNVLVGFGMIRANRDQLRSLDEMQQRIHLESMGLTLGVGLVVGLAYSTLDIANVISFDAEIPHLVILLGLTYLGTVLFGNWKYR